MADWIEKPSTVRRIHQYLPTFSPLEVPIREAKYGMIPLALEVWMLWLRRRSTLTTCWTG